MRELLDRISIKDVAKAAGTSVSTVSRALNDHPDVSPETRQRILDTATRMGYERNPFAQGLISGKSGLLAVIVHDIDNDYQLQLMRGCSTVAKAYEQELLLVLTEERDRVLGACLSVYRRGLADGAMVAGPLPDEEEGLLRLQNAGFPIVAVHPKRPIPGLTTIEPMDRDGALSAVRYLLGLGHRRIGLIVELPEWGAGQHRLTGYEAALTEADIGADPALIHLGIPGSPEESGRVAIEHWCELGTKMTAVLCFNDLVAYGAIRELAARGIRVPEDMSVIGFDDLPNSEYFAMRGLTTVRQPITQIGELAMETLVKLCEGELEPGDHIHVPTELIVRGTTGRVTEHQGC